MHDHINFVCVIFSIFQAINVYISHISFVQYETFFKNTVKIFSLFWYWHSMFQSINRNLKHSALFYFLYYGSRYRFDRCQTSLKKIFKTKQPSKTAYIFTYRESSWLFFFLCICRIKRKCYLSDIFSFQKFCKNK